jgi:hypothetical protein
MDALRRAKALLEGGRPIPPDVAALLLELVQERLQPSRIERVQFRDMHLHEAAFWAIAPRCPTEHPWAAAQKLGDEIGRYRRASWVRYGGRLEIPEAPILRQHIHLASTWAPLPTSERQLFRILTPT